MYGVSDNVFVGLTTKSRVDFYRAFFRDISLKGDRFSAKVPHSNPLLQHPRSQAITRSASSMLKATAEEEAFIRLFIQEYADDAIRIFLALIDRFPKFGDG